MFDTLLAMLLTLMKRVKKLAANVALPFTQDDKDKLDSISNPMLVKGTVADKETLEAITDAKPGWVFFVGEDGTDKVEYVWTKDGAWEQIGSGGLDQNEFVKKTDYATPDTPGVVGVYKQYGVGILSTNHRIFIDKATEVEINDGENNYKPIVPSNIEFVMRSYGVTSKTLIGWILKRLDELDKKGTVEPAAAAAHAVRSENVDNEHESEDDAS